MPKPTISSPFACAVALLLALLFTSACSRNPATGKFEALVPKQPEEVALGQEAALSLQGVVALYDEDELRELLTRVGARIASTTERPGLPWTFLLVDDPTPNAFALPGGSVYVTRGLLPYLSSESELASVLAHEIAHVTARHGVRTLQRLAHQQNRAGRSSIETHLPVLSQVGSRGVARFLQRSRDEELLADGIALRYLARANYEALALADALETLGTLHGGPGFEDPRTHPTTVHRRAQIHASLGRSPDEPPSDPAYLDAIDGMMFGPDPREGYFKDGAFVHPRMGFALRLPEHWTVEYRGGRAVAKNLESDTLLTVSESRAASVRAGMNEVFLRDVGKRDPWEGRLEGHFAAMAEFSTTHEDKPIYAFVGLVEFEGKIIQVVAFSTSAQWPAKATREVFQSFTAASAAQENVEPMTVEIVEVAESTSLRELYEASPSSVPLSVVARINHLDPEADLAPGQRLKRIRGFNPDFASVL
ncbi:MAG TPA: M48 family metalloprotease [Nannocystaceae bacterium]|nr:M48 family metalloprotease [Nannocystaceae bacterium]